VINVDVAFISFLYPNVDHTGGSTYTFNLCKALAKRVNLTVFVPDVGEPQKTNREIRHSPCKVLNLNLLRPSTFVVAAAQKLRKMRFNIIHSHCGSGLFLSKVSVETFHHKPSLLDAFPQIVCLKKAKHIIAVSLRSKQELLQMGFDEDKITTVSNGIDHERFFPNLKARALLKQKLNLEEENPIIFCVPADGTKRKNLPLMLKTVKHLKEEGKDSILLMVGSMNVKMKVLRLARKFGVLSSLRYIEGVSNDDMPLYYSACDFLAHPSLREGFGFVLLEAVASGRPFVSMDVGVAQELANQGFGYVTRTAQEFMEKCLRMADKPLRVWERGNRFVKENYSWERCAKETIRVYESIL